jgi:hypothetical protein
VGADGLLVTTVAVGVDASWVNNINLRIVFLDSG